MFFFTVDDVVTVTDRHLAVIVMVRMVVHSLRTL